MKKILALACAFAMLAALAIPAMGEGKAKTLEEITLGVKQALDISDDYTDFTSDQYDGTWNLTWTNAAKTVYVSTTMDGEITSYSAYENYYNYSYSNEFAPRFPVAETAQIDAIARDFLGRVIGEGKGWRLDQVSESLENDNVTSAYVSGRLVLGEYPTDVTISLTIDLEKLEVTNYYRGDGYMKFVSDAFDTALTVAEDEARALLRDKTALSLEYYAVNYGEKAVLCYIRDYDGNYVVRASDGEVINVEDAYAGGNGEGESYMAGSYDSSTPLVKRLTDVELEGISVYDGALTWQELDAKARAFAEFGLTDEYGLTSVDYYNNGDILQGSLQYSRKVPDAELGSRYGLSETQIADLTKIGNAHYDSKSVTLDAKTGELSSMYTSHPYIYGAYKNDVDTEAGRAISDAFIRKYFPDIFDSIEFTDSNHYAVPYYYAPTAYYNYSRLHQGYRFDGNSVNVSINAEDGTIDSFNLYWDKKQEFEEPDPGKLISADEAYATYTGNLTFEAALVSVPGPDGYGNYKYTRVLAWRYVDDYNTYGVNATTGELLSYGSYSKTAFAYSDVAGHDRQAAIEKLAQYGIGFAGGTFEPDKALTMRDMLTILLQADGYTGLDSWEYKDICSSAMYIGAPDFSATDPESPVAKGFFAGLIVDLYGLDGAANFKGIYALDFADEAAIPAADYGHIALAYGMGLIAPDQDNNIAPDAELTRADGAQILHNFLARPF